MLEAVYKRDSAGIFNNLSTTIILQSEDLGTNKYYSELFGNYTVEVVSQSQTSSNSSGSSTKSYSFHRAQLLPPNDLAEWGYETGHLVMNSGRLYACSSLPISKTFVGDMLGLHGVEPGDLNLGDIAPRRPIKNPDPAPSKTWSDLNFSSECSAIAQAIDAMTEDPRYY